MSTTKEVTALLLSCLPGTLDPCLEAESFRRSSRALDYLRTLDAGAQRIKLVFDVNPRYQPGALAHLLPQARLVFPELNNRVREMMGDDRSLIGPGGATVSEQLQNLAPRDVRTRASSWFVFDEKSACASVESIREFVEEWILPFLNTYTTAAALTDGYEQEDERLRRDRRFLLFIVAEYTLRGRPDKAMHVLELRLGKPGLRRQYARAFEYVSELSARL
jgi:hypothetical protein